MHTILPFLALTTGMLVMGYVFLFDASATGRSTGFALIAAAAVLTGALVSANFNGGKPYGWDVPIGFAKWKKEGTLPGKIYPQRVAPAPEENLKVPEDSGVPIA